MKRSALAAALLLVVLTGQGQERLGKVQGRRPREPRAAGATSEFTFVRTIFHSPFRGRRWGSWATDFPEADHHFIVGVRFWSGSNLDISEKPVQLEILDERIVEIRRR